MIPHLSLCCNQELRVVSNIETSICSEQFRPTALTPSHRTGEMSLKYEYYAVKNTNELNI